MTFHPWTAPDQVCDPSPVAPAVKRDPVGLARFYQSLLDRRVVENRAGLARYLGVSRARVTQVLARLRSGSAGAGRE